jgi:hypothetical protein
MTFNQQVRSRLGFILLFAAFQFSMMMSQGLGNITHNWSKAAISDSTGGKCSGVAVARDINNNLYVAGTFSGVADFDPSVSLFKIVSASTLDDIFIAKYSAAGNFIYAKCIAGVGTKTVGSLTVDNSGYLYLCGGFNGIADFDPSAAANTLMSVNNTNDGFIVKYDLNGNLINVSQIGSLGSEYVSSIAINTSGNVYATGNFQGVSDFDPSSATFSLTSIGADDIFFAKYSSAGNLQFVNNIGGVFSDVATSISIGKNSTIHLTGYFTDVVDFDPSIAIATRTSQSSSQDVFVTKYDSTGNYLYAINIGGSGNDRPLSIKSDTSDASYICGYFQGVTDFDPSSLSYNLSTTNSQAGFIAKYNSLGNFVYAQQISSGFTNSNYAGINSLVIDKNNSAYITGFLVTVGPFANTTSSVVIAKYNSIGTNLYFKLLPGFSGCNGRAIAIDTIGNSFITGAYNMQINVDPSNSIYNLYAPANDAFIASYDSIGNFNYGGTLGTYFDAGFIVPSQTKLDDAGNVYVIGSLKGAYNFDPFNKLVSSISSNSFGVSYTSSDIYFAKYDSVGNLLWSRIIGGSAIDNGVGIAINKSGSIYITGTYQKIADFDPSPSIYTLTTLYNSYNTFIAKYDLNGNFVFAKPIECDDAIFGFSIEIDDSSNVYLSGDFKGTADFDPSVFTATLTGYGFSSNPQYDCYFAKYDSLGNYKYVRQIGGAGDDGNTLMSIDSIGSVYISGLFSGSVDFDITSGVYILNSLTGYNFLAKYDAAGNLLYAKNIAVNAITSSKKDKVGNVYIAGYFYGTADLDLSSALGTFTSQPGYYSSFFAKYDSNGNYIFSKVFDTKGYSGISLDIDTTNSIFIGGSFSGTVDFDDSPSVANLSSMGSIDAYVAKYTASGNYAYAKAFGGTLDDRITPVCVSRNGSNLILSGTFNGVVDFDPSASIAPLNSGTLAGLFIASYNSCMFPATQTSFNALNFCEANSTNLIAQSSGVINWYSSLSSSISLSTGSVYTTPILSASNYSYYIEGSTCSSGRAMQVVNVNPTPTIIVNSGYVCFGNSYTLAPSGAQTYTITGGLSVVSPTISSSYSIIGTSTSGCVALTPAIANLTVLTLPLISTTNDSLCLGQSYTIQASGALNYTYSSGTPIISPTTTASYSITGTDQLGCVSSNIAVANIVVKPIPIISATNGTICEGDAFTFNPTDATSYSYPIGGPIVTPTVNTNYIIIGLGNNQCTSTLTISVNVNSSPNISINNGSICAGNFFTLSPSGGQSYSVTGNNWVVSPSSNITYSVTGTSSLGCVSATPAISAITVYSLPIISASSGSICRGDTFVILPSGADTYSYSTGSQSVSPINTSVFYVNGANVFGCISAAPASVTIVVNPTPNITVSGTTICNGETYTITPTGAQSYTYSGGGPIVSPNISTTYTVIGETPNGCRSSVQLSVTVNPTPTLSVNSGSICSGQIYTITPSGANTYTISGGSFTVSPNASSVYTINSNSQNCPFSSSVVANVIVLPSPTITCNSGSICSGQSFTILPSGASTYSYSGGSPIVTPTISSLYNIIGADNQGCLSSAAAICQVTVYSSPTVSAISSNTICIGTSSTIQAIGATTYTWSDGQTSSVITVSPTITTSYTVIGSNAYGCVDSFNVSQNVDNCSYIETDDTAKILPQIFPNPNNGVFTIQSPQYGQVKIIDALGRSISYHKLLEGNNVVVLPIEIANGIYFAMIHINGKVLNVKVIKQK